MQDGRIVGKSAQGVRHVRQRLVVDVDEFQRVLRDGAAGRGHAHHRLAFVDRLCARERVVRQRRRAGHGSQHGQRLARGPHVGTRQDVPDAGEGAGLAHVDRADRRAGEGASAHRHLELVGHLHVVGEEAVAAQQAVVLLAGKRRADEAPALPAQLDAPSTGGSGAWPASRYSSTAQRMVS